MGTSFLRCWAVICPCYRQRSERLLRAREAVGEAQEEQLSGENDDHEPLRMEVRTPAVSFKDLRQSSRTLTRYFTCESFRDDDDAGESDAPVDNGQNTATLDALVGHWEGVPGSLEGMEDMLKVSGANWALRKMAAKAAGSFVPKLEVSREGSKVLLVSVTFKGVERTEVVINGPPFEGAFGPQQRKGIGKASVDGEVLVIKMELGTTGDESLEIRRWIDPWVEEDILQESITLRKGKESATMKRRFKKTAG
eukprot:TRINITY_DN48817_c0_g1_i2.p1 TRINITY_DN48817_c0_g1~~TRINITY_DN48817_c0_g1_i2.p1  ORF type:complete len:252 (+),score=46.95 TRINITY_DN48817_c0_g1_i2:19-774(+)